MTLAEYIVKKLNLADAPGSSSARDPKKSVIKRLGLAFVDSTGAAARKDFAEPDFNLEEITKAYNADSYVRQAIDKYVDLMFKAGWDIVGKNQKAVEYINIRMAVFAEATQTPTKQFLIDIAEDLVKYGNAFVIKARMKGGQYVLPAGVTATGIAGVEPIAGYFVLPPTTIRIAREETGVVAQYQQNISGKNPITFKPEDVIHIYWKKERGQAFGVPFLLPVLDDVKILRQVEEDVIRLIYRHLFPLYAYKVGIAEPGFEATDEEIEGVRDQIRAMPLDGGLVIPERHSIEVIGAENQALDVEGYLEYFRKRVFTGLGVSETIMGIGDTANRGTAESMTTEMHDRIKAFQRVMSEFFNHFIITEILREGGFDPIVKPEDAVLFSFKEIDLDSRTKLENQAIQLWINSLITFEEARQVIGHDPVADEARLYFQMIGHQDIEKQAEADTTVAVAKAQSTPAPKKTAKTAATSGHINLTESTIDAKLNVSRYAERLEYYWDLTRADIIELVKQYYISGERDFNDFEDKEIAAIIQLTRESINNQADKYVRSAFLAGVDACRHQASHPGIPNVNYEANIRELINHHKTVIERLMSEDLSYTIKKTIRRSTSDDVVTRIMGAFQALRYRLTFISNSELYRAYNYGFIKCSKALGYDSLDIDIEDGCPVCDPKGEKPIPTTHATVTSTSIPPYHPNCTCKLKIPAKEV